MKKNVASQKIGAQMITASDGSAFTGSVTASVTGDAGTQATGSVGSGACTHEGNGYHTYAPAQAETNYDLIAFTFTGTGAIPATVQVFTAFPQTGDNFALIGATGSGLTSLASAANLATAAAYIDTEVAAALAAVDTEVAAIKTKTDFLPSATAGASGGLLISGSNAGTTTLGALTVTGTTTLDDVLLAGDFDITQTLSITDVTIYGDLSVAGTITATDGANAISGVQIDPTERLAFADALLNRDMALGTDSGSDSARTVRQALRALRNKWTSVSGTYTVYKENDTDPSWDAATTGTAGADPITASDPTGP